MPHDRLLPQDRGRNPGRRPSTMVSRASDTDAEQLLSLQRDAGNKAVGDAVAAKTSMKGVAQIGKVTIKVADGNLAKWAAGEVPDWLEVTSQKGGHSAALERLSQERTRIDSLVVTMAAANKGQVLDMGSLAIEFTNARIKGYAVDGTTETWRVTDFDAVHRTKTTRKVS